MILSPRVVRFSTPPTSFVIVREVGEDQKLLAANQKGFHAGYEKASQALSLQLLEQRTQIANLQENTLKAICGQFEMLLVEVQQAVPALAIDIARRALAGVSLDAVHVKAIANEVLAELAPGTPGIKLRFCPRDLQTVQDLAEEFTQKYPGLELVADPDLVPGDCMASSHFGTIDARLSGKLENIAHALL